MIRSHPSYRFAVGRTEKRQYFWTPALQGIVVLEFDSEGVFASAEYLPQPSGPDAFEVATALFRDRGVADTPISVQKFWLDDCEIGVRDLPESLIEFVDNPDDFSAEEKTELTRALREWKKQGRFVLFCEEEFEMSSVGEVVGH